MRAEPGREDDERSGERKADAVNTLAKLRRPQARAQDRQHATALLAVMRRERGRDKLLRCGMGG